MPEPAGIAVSNLTKQFGTVTAVRDLSFTARPGAITGFLGPNGSGKTTTMRAILGLVAPTSGAATINGKRYRQLRRPSSVVGAVLDAAAFHPSHAVRDHLHIYRAMGGYPAVRVGQVLDLVGLTTAADRKTRTLSTGMRQRLNLATALLGDAHVLVLDEPTNGLDPAGIAWLRGLLRDLAAQGRTILISSHVLSEVEQIVDDVVVIRGGRLVESGHLAGLAGQTAVRVRTPDTEALAAVLASPVAGVGVARVEPAGPGQLRVYGLSTDQLGDLARAHGLAIHGLATDGVRLEERFLQWTQDTEETR